MSLANSAYVFICTKEYSGQILPYGFIGSGAALVVWNWFGFSEVYLMNFERFSLSKLDTQQSVDPRIYPHKSLKIV